MDRNAAVKILKQHAAELKKRRVTGMYLFGSMARNEATRHSDVDIFFDYEPDGHFSLFDLMDIQEFVGEILGTRADVIPRNSLHRRIKDDVVGDALRIF